MLALILSQHLFYGSNGHWPNDVAPRYLFPGMLAENMAFFLSIVVIAKMASIKFPKLAETIWVIYLAGALSFLMLSVENITSNRAASIKRVVTTSSLTNRLDEAFIYLRAHPSAALLLNSHNVWDYEPIFSIYKFVRASGLINPIAININGYSPNSFSKNSQPLEFKLASTLLEIQHFGNSKFVPLHTTETNATCFSMGITGPPLVRCESGNIVWSVLDMN